MSALSDLENVRLHDVEGGDVRDNPAWRALLGEDPVKAFLADMAAKHLPGMHNQEDHGHGHGHHADVIPGDKLKLAGRIPLGPGETLVSSGKVASGFPFAVTRSDSGHRLRLGIVDPGDERSWSGRRLGGTVALDSEGIRELRSRAPDVAEKAQLYREEMREAADRIDDFDGFDKYTFHSSRGWSFDDDVTPEQQELIKRHFEMRDGHVFERGALAVGSNDSLMYEIQGEDGESDDESVRVIVGVRSEDVDHETWDITDGHHAQFDQDEFEAWAEKLAKVLVAPELSSGLPKSASREMQGKHLPGVHDQRSHGRRRPRVPAPDVPLDMPEPEVFAAPKPPRRPRRQPSAPSPATSESGGVRKVLQEATTAGDISAAAQKESERITDAGVWFDLDGADPQVARELAEGVLRGLERFPRADLTRVRLNKNMTNGHSVMAEVVGDEMLISADWAGDPQRFRDAMKHHHAEGDFVGDSPMATAIHEFGHVVALTGDSETSAGQLVMSTASARSIERSQVRGFVESQISNYAAFNEPEMTAEAFADVMLNGDKASDLSKVIFKHLEQQYRRAVS